MSALRFEYSPDGGGAWFSATPALTSSAALQSLRQGAWHTFLWNARADQAIGDNMRFGITLFPNLGATGGVTEGTHQGGEPQRAIARAVSLPFRVRGTDCACPQGLSVNFAPAHPGVNEEVRFEAILTQASGLLDYIWDFGDGSPLGFGPVVHHTYTGGDVYRLVLTVRSSPCPLVRELTTAVDVRVGGGFQVYLPLVLK
jgi:hypothetical protein